MNDLKSIKLTILVLALATGVGATRYAAAEARPINSEEATRIALKQMPGTLVKVEREHELGIFYFEVEVRSDNGLIYEVNIAADDGRVLSVELDD